MRATFIANRHLLLAADFKGSDIRLSEAVEKGIEGIYLLFTGSWLGSPE
jgi:hypothetical protein